MASAPLSIAPIPIRPPAAALPLGRQPDDAFPLARRDGMDDLAAPGRRLIKAPSALRAPRR